MMRWLRTTCSARAAPSSVKTSSRPPSRCSSPSLPRPLEHLADRRARDAEHVGDARGVRGRAFGGLVLPDRRHEEVDGLQVVLEGVPVRVRHGADDSPRPRRATASRGRVPRRGPGSSWCGVIASRSPPQSLLGSPNRGYQGRAVGHPGRLAIRQTGRGTQHTMRLHVRSTSRSPAACWRSASPRRPSAGTVTTTNACLYSVNGEYRNQPVTLSGVGSPRDAAAGAIATLSGASLVGAAAAVAARRQGYELGIFTAGLQPDPVARLGRDRRRERDPGDAGPRAERDRVDDDQVERLRRAFVSGTPIVVTIPIPDTTWTVAGTGPVAFSQAGPGTLPSLPVGINDEVVAGQRQHRRQAEARQPALRHGLPARHDRGAVQDLDARAGRAVRGARGAPVPPSRRRRRQPPPKRARSPRRSSSGSRVGRVGVAIACPAGLDACKGRVALRSRAPLRVGTARAVLDRSRRRDATRVAAGAHEDRAAAAERRPRALLRTRRTLRLRVTLTPAPARPSPAT